MLAIFNLGAAELSVLLGGGFCTALVVGVIVFAVLLIRKKNDPDVQPQPASGPGIFISYRRSDSQDATGRIYDALVHRFSKDSVFKDVDSIPLGKDYRKVLEKAVTRARLVIVVIGPRWLNAKTAAGQRRLEDANDAVRIEIETALAGGVPVIPVMVSNAKMVNVADLPGSMKQLAFQNGLAVRPDPDFHRDMERLCCAIEKMVPAARSNVAAPREVPRARGIGSWIGRYALAVLFGVIAMVIGAICYLFVKV